MFPVLLSIGKFSVSSFGVFLALGFLLNIFLIWRLARAWDLDEEKILDLALLTFVGGLIGARIYFAMEHFSLFSPNLLRIILLTRYPGFSFWGGFLGGWLSLYFFVRRFKMDFWQVADIASVGFLGGLILANIGCFFGSCAVGIPSKAFFAVTMVGKVGTRFPTQAIEAILLTIILTKIWSSATHFHLRGKIVSISLIYLGIIKLLLEPLNLEKGYFFDSILVILGITILYVITKRNIVTDLINSIKFILSLVTKTQSRKRVLQILGKTWYNQKTSFSWKLRNLKKVLKRSNVKFSHKNP